MQALITPDEADKIIRKHLFVLADERVVLDKATRRVLSKALKADRNFPAGNLSTMDGIAISHRAIIKNISEFKILGTQPAGTKPLKINKLSECIEITTGALLNKSLDTVIPYEDLLIADNQARLKIRSVIKGQHVRLRASDRAKGDIVLQKNARLQPKDIAICASIGVDKIPVYKKIDLMVIATGNELTSSSKKPKNYQIRASNNYLLTTALKNYSNRINYKILKDDKELLKNDIRSSLRKHDCLILSGGVSKGRYDFIPQILFDLGANILFHGVNQKPGKPFLFATLGNKIIFALPGNPVSSTLCLYRYIVPWLNLLQNQEAKETKIQLNFDIKNKLSKTWFVPVSTQQIKSGATLATRVKNNSSGDLTSLVNCDGFIELPPSAKIYKKGSSVRLWSII